MTGEETKKMTLKEQRENTKVEIPDKSISQCILEGFKINPERAAYHFMGTTHSFHQLNDMATRFANYLIKTVGCKQDDVIAVHLPQTPQFKIATAGAFMAGCRVTGVSALLTAKELAYQLNDSGAKVLVTLDALFENFFLPVKDELPNITDIVVTNIGDYVPAFKRVLGKLLKKLPTGKIVPVSGKTIKTFKEVIAQHQPDPCPDFETDKNDTCLLMYTGGTTGVPKGCEITQGNVVAINSIVEALLDLTPGKEIICTGFPFFHIAGMTFNIGSMTQAWTQILVPDPRNTKYIVDSISKYGTTFLANVPTLYLMLMDEPGFASLGLASNPDFKVAISGAAPFASKPYRDLEEILGKGKLSEAYGLTESCATLTTNPVDGEKKLGSVGVPIPGVRTKIVDIETGTREMPQGEEGEIIAIGSTVMKGYLNKPEETAKALREFQGETWFYTGDVGKEDEDGYLFIVDRTKDMILVGGYNVFSTEVEDAIFKHSAVDLCAVIGAPNPDREGDELVKAVIQLKAEFKDEDPEKIKQEIVALCREEKAVYKVPKILEFIDEIPVTAIGKVEKKLLR